MTLPVPEGDDDGHLTDEWLDLLRAEPMPTQAAAAAFLVETFPICIGLMSACSIKIEDGETRMFRHPCKVIHFSTGGWSGAEELIQVMLSKTWLKQFHESWEKGGHYVFHVPLIHLKRAK